MSPDAAAVATPALPEARRERRLLAALGIGLIWLFLAVFLLYPLARIFYDALTDDTGALTLRNFVEFFGDGFYLRSLWNSMLLGLGVDELSIAPAAVPPIKYLIRRLKMSEAKEIAQAALTSESSAETLDKCQRLVRSVAPSLFEK